MNWAYYGIVLRRVGNWILDAVDWLWTALFYLAVVIVLATFFHLIFYYWLHVWGILP